jgi:Fur family transcriptional regulator, zinc uptake regulator
MMNAPHALHPHNHRLCIDDALSRAETVCAERGAKMTPLRRRVLELVWDSHAPIGAYAIMELLRAADDRSAAPPTVYRALDFLLDQGLVHKIESLNAFVGCDRPEERHVSQFLICTSCKAAVELTDPAIMKAVESSARDSGFSFKRLTVEAQGLCAACSKAPKAA